MNKDDRRYRGAYHLLRSHMDMLIASGHLTGLPKAEAESLLDSVKVELSSTCADGIGDELVRHKEALRVAIGALRELGLDYAHFTETVEKRVAAVLEPPEEFEEVEVVRWLDTVNNCCYEEPDLMGHEIRDNSKLVKLTGTVTRPVKRAVVKEIEVEAEIGGIGAKKTYLNEGDAAGLDQDCPFRKFPECHGKTGTLIFRWTE